MLFQSVGHGAQARDHFRVYPLTGHIADITETTRLPSRPGEFHPEPLTDSGREPLDSSGSCHRTKAPRSAVLVPFVALQSFSQSLCDEKGVGGLLQAPDLAVSDCPEMGESGLH